MNKNQKIAILVAAAIILIMGLFPPVERPISKGNHYKHEGYQFIFNISSGYLLKVNTKLLLIQWAGMLILGVGGVLYFSGKD